MWCTKCHFGSEHWAPYRLEDRNGDEGGTVQYGFCNRCGSDQLVTDTKPFPQSPTGKGAGKPNGKTERNKPTKKKA